METVSWLACDDTDPGEIRCTETSSRFHCENMMRHARQQQMRLQHQGSRKRRVVQIKCRTMKIKSCPKESPPTKKSKRSAYQSSPTNAQMPKSIRKKVVAHIATVVKSEKQLIGINQDRKCVHSRCYVKLRVRSQASGIDLSFLFGVVESALTSIM